jgi:hypothetical protein
MRGSSQDEVSYEVSYEVSWTLMVRSAALPRVSNREATRPRRMIQLQTSAMTDISGC